jgi:hypothetical protein
MDDLCRVAARHGDRRKAKYYESDEEDRAHEDDVGVSAWGGIKEVIGVDAGDRAPNHGVDQVDRGPDEPDQRAAPGERLALSAEEKPVEDVEKRNEIVEQDVSYFFETLRIPNVPKEKRVSEADDGDVDSGGGFQVGTGAVRGEGDSGADAGDEKVAEDGEEAAVANDDGGEVEAFRERIGDRKVETQSESQPGEKREKSGGSTGCCSCGHRQFSLKRYEVSIDTDAIWRASPSYRSCVIFAAARWCLKICDR